MDHDIIFGETGRDGRLRTSFSLDKQGLDKLDLSLPASRPGSRVSLPGLAIGTALGLALAAVPWRGEHVPRLPPQPVRG